MRGHTEHTPTPTQTPTPTPTLTLTLTLTPALTPALTPSLTPTLTLTLTLTLEQVRGHTEQTLQSEADQCTFNPAIDKRSRKMQVPAMLPALHHIRLQPGGHTVAAWRAYGCSLNTLRLQGDGEAAVTGAARAQQLYDNAKGRDEKIHKQCAPNPSPSPSPSPSSSLSPNPNPNLDPLTLTL